MTTGDAVICTRGLTKRYGATVALRGLDLRVDAGEVYGLVGPNGAGKTTTFRLLLGLQRATGGEAQLFGRDAFTDSVAIHRRLAHVCAGPGLWPGLTGDETLDLLGSLHGSTDSAYQRRLIDRFALDTRREVRALSSGNRQKVALIAALATRADLLALDEPTTGLDPLMEMAFRLCVDEARDRGQTVLLSSHRLSEVEAVCDRVGILRAGRLVDEGTIAELAHLTARVVEVTFSGEVPCLPELDGVRVRRTSGQAVRCEVTGPLAPLIDALAGTGVAALSSREPSLEEIFVSHYQPVVADVGA